MWANTGQNRISESKEQKLLIGLIDRDMKFDEYILKQCKKAGTKRHALETMFKFLNLERQKPLMKAFIESHFADCPLVSCNYNTNYISYCVIRYLWFSDVFRGYQKRSVAWNGLIICMNEY